MHRERPGAVAWVLATTFAFLSACDDAEPPAPVDDASAPADAGSDARVDTMLDATVDAARDAGTDASEGADAAQDAGTFSCDVAAPTACPDPAPRYADVAPIFTTRCVVCHAGNWNGPWPLNTYEHVADWRDTVRANLLDCTMPPRESGIPMTDEERLQILTWIRCNMPR